MNAPVTCQNSQESFSKLMALLLLIAGASLLAKQGG